jgi:hypothetical protein
MPGQAQRVLGDIEYGEIAVAGIEQPVDRHRGSAADVDNRLGGTQLDVLDQLLKPTCSQLEAVTHAGLGDEMPGRGGVGFQFAPQLG